MEIIIFIGIQAAGKSTFYKENFFKSHIRINLDMLKTRARENILLDACLRAKQPMVIDNTNSTLDERRKYIDQSRDAGFKVIGYFFQSTVKEAIARNESRMGKEKIPSIAIAATYNKLAEPSYGEGFDELYHVSIGENNSFTVKTWK